MPGTTSIGHISNKLSKSPSVAPIALSINPRGERSLGQNVTTAQRHPRIRSKLTRDYGKDDTVPVSFNLPGYGKEFGG